MSRMNVYSYEQRLGTLLKYSPSSDDLDELQAHWARYLCVLVSGYLEVAVRATLRDFAARQVSPNVERFVDQQLNRFNNPKFARIIELTGSFSPLWAESLRDASEGEIKDHINSIVANRHLIAHGRDSEVTLVRVREWYSSAKKLIRELENLCAL